MSYADTMRAVLRGDGKSFVVFASGTVVIFVDAAREADLAAAARELLAEWGPVYAGSPAGDFRTMDLEPDAYDVVVLGHVCRTEGIDGAPALIRRAFDALKPEGRLLVADYFPDDARKANPFGVLMGATMMASTERGFTFTHGQYTRWLRDAGFRPVRLIEPIGFNQVYVATKPR